MSRPRSLPSTPGRRSRYRAVGLAAVADAHDPTLGAGDDGGLLAGSAQGVGAGAGAGGWVIAGSLGCGVSGVVSAVTRGDNGTDRKIAGIWPASPPWYIPTPPPPPARLP